MILAIAILVVSSCAPCYYAPSAQNVPLFTEKKQGKLSGGYKIGSYTQGCDFQTAVSITDHLGIIANYSFFKGRDAVIDDNKDYSDRFRSNMFEVGMGYYQVFHQKMVFEAYAGYGSDNIHNDYTSEYGGGSSSLHSSSFFLQPALGVCWEHVELAFSTRLRVLNFTKADYNSKNHSSSWYAINDIKLNPVHAFIEPAFTARFGGENVKFQIQVGISNHIGRETAIDYDPFNFNMGLVFRFKGKKKPDETEK